MAEERKIDFNRPVLAVVGYILDEADAELRTLESAQRFFERRGGQRGASEEELCRNLVWLAATRAELHNPRGASHTLAHLRARSRGRFRETEYWAALIEVRIHLALKESREARARMQTLQAESQDPRTRARQQALNHHVTGRALAAEGQFRQALREYEHAVVTLKVGTAQLDDLAITTVIYNDQALALSSDGRVEDALRCYLQAETVAKHILFPLGLSRGLLGRAQIYLGRKDYPEAIKLFKTARELYQRHESAYGIARCSIGLGQAYYGASDLREAITYFEEARLQCGNGRYPAEEAEVNARIGEVMLSAGAGEQEELARITPHLRVYMDSARIYQVQQEALEFESGLRRQSEMTVTRLAMMLDALRQLVGVRSPTELLQLTFDLLGKLLPHQARYLAWGDLRLTEPATREARAKFKELLRAPVAGAQREWVTFPLAAGESAALPGGWLFLSAGAGSVFRNEDVEALRLFLWNVGSLLENAHLYAELKQALGELRSSQAQVVQSSKLAAIGQLAAGVAHELNTPLAAVCVALDGAIMAAHKPEKVKQRLEKAEPAINQMKEIISKLLYYSRDAGTGRRDLDLAKVVQDSLQLVGHIFRVEGIAISLELAPVPPILANASEIQQVITNLLVNAKYACLSPGAPGKKIVMRTYASVPPQVASPVAVLEVEDQGCGMDEDTCKRIFEPFFTTKPVGQGTGLGLSTTMMILQQHQGTIEVQSKVGKGTRFTVRLPLHLDPGDAVPMLGA